MKSITALDDTILSQFYKNNPYKIHFEGRKNKFNYKLINDKIGYLYIKEKSDTYIVGDYTVLPDKDNNFYKNVDTVKYNPLEEETKKTVGGYFPLFFIDLTSGKLFFQDMSEVSSFKVVFNKWLNSKDVYLENVLVENPKEAIKNLFGSVEKIEICKIENSEDTNLISNINKKIDKKLIKTKTVLTVKKEFKLKVSEFVDELFDGTNLDDFAMLKVKGKSKNDNKELPTYDVIKDSLIIKNDFNIDTTKFSYEKDREYVLSVFTKLNQDSQKNS